MEKRVAAAQFRKGGTKKKKKGSVRGGGGGGGGGRKKAFNEQSRRASFIPENVNELVSEVSATASQATNAGMKALRAKAKKLKKGGDSKYAKLS